MNAPTYLLSTNFLTVFTGNVSRQINKNDNRYTKAVSLIKRKDWAGLLDLLDQPAALAKYSDGLIRVFDNEVHYNGAPIGGVAVNKVLEFMKEGLPIEPLARFLNNLYQNTDDKIREQLYTFLENNNLAITERGSFLAFKLVKDDGRPYYQGGGKIQNDKGEWIDAFYKVGETYLYDKSRIRKTTGECSTEGIYVGNRNYWNGEFNENDEYTGDGLMLIVEIYPQDVENVPHADATKIVVSKCKVVEQYKALREHIVKPLWNEGGESQDNFDDIIRDDEFSGIKVLRDNNGRFIGKSVTILNKPKRDSFGRFVGKGKVAKVTKPKRDGKGRFLPKN